MAYASPYLESAVLPDDYTPAKDPLAQGRGRVARPWELVPRGSFFGASKWTPPKMDEQEIRERIKEHDAKKTSLRHLAEANGLKVKNQASTNYCWINAPTRAVEVARLAAGQPFVELSPASGGAIIKNFKNQGGWGTEALEFIAEEGLVPSALWPNNAIDRRYNTSAANAERSKYRVTEWAELTPRHVNAAQAFHELMACVVLNIPVPVGYDWWGHEVNGEYGVILKNGDLGLGIANSWSPEWGDNGYGILTRAKATPDDAVAPRVAVAA